jgi:hypothetical protein
MATVGGTFGGGGGGGGGAATPTVTILATDGTPVASTTNSM